VFPSRESAASDSAPKKAITATSSLEQSRIAPWNTRQNAMASSDDKHSGVVA